MKYFCRLFLISVLLVSTNVSAQWTRLSGPEGCAPTAFIKLSNEILCGTVQGIYSTSDEGVSWTDYTNFPAKQIVALANFSDTIVILFCSEFVEGLYFDSLFSCTSFDGGNSWSNPYFLSTSMYASMHAYGNTLMASTSERLIISYDCGISWNTVQMPSAQHFGNVDFFDKMFSLHTSDINYTNSFSYWGFGGDTLFHLYDTLGTIRGLVAIDTVFFAYQMNTGSFYDIIRSTNLIATWQPVATFNQSTNFRLLVDNGLLYCSSNTYQVSADLGNTWNPSGIPHIVDYPLSIPISNGDELCSSEYGSLFHYVSATDSAYLSQSGIRGSNVSFIASNDSDIYVTNNNGGIVKSHDMGQTWDSLGMYGTNNLLLFGDTIFCTYFFPQRSYDGGQTWTSLANAPTIFNLAKSGNRIYGSWQDTYYSDDFGDHWTMLPNVTIQGNCSGNAGSGPMVVFNNELYSISNDGVVARFDVAGNGWVEELCLIMQPNNYFQPTIQIANNNLIVTTDVRMYTSADGRNWIVPALNGIPNGYMGHKVCPQSIVGFNGDMIGTCGKYGIFYSWNGGNDWLPFTASTPFIANCLSIINNQLYAGSFYQGLWKSNVILGLNESDRFYSSAGNIFPNPCNEYFKIRLPEGVFADRIYLIDNLGRKVIDREIDKNLNEVNTSRLPEGIYYVQALYKNKITCNYKIAVIR